MYITYDNRKEVDKLYIYDSEFEGFVYDYDKRQISFTCENYNLHKTSFFKFNNVIWFNMQSCYFWGGGNSILNITLKEDAEQLNKLMEIQNSKPEHKYSYLDRGIKYITIEMEINSGDVLLLICESIVYREEDWTK